MDYNNLPAENRKILVKGIKQHFLQIADKYKVNLPDEEPYFMFSKLIKKLSNKFNKGVVVLIDEYDKPIISQLGKGKKGLKIAQENQRFLKIIYDNLKGLETYLRLVFITGISKFSKVSIFSTLNNLIELDIHPQFSTILGFTEQELKTNFEDYFTKFSNELNITEKELLEKFQKMYNGFKFHKDAEKVYNPFSVGKALEFREIDDYWFESGTPSFLVDLIKDRGFDVTTLNNLEIGRDELKAYDIEKLQLIPLLFQTGYLTIKSIEDDIIYTLGYPNHEVKRGFKEILKII